MIQHGQHWTCLKCVVNTCPGHPPAPDMFPARSGVISVLNLYSGVGGNRWLWPAAVEVTAVENNPLIAAEYAGNFPKDKIVIGDAHKFLLLNYNKYDIIWTSPPCQTHSRVNVFKPVKRYADLSLYQEIIFLKSFFKGKYVVENVKPYYTPLMTADFDISRHLFWTNVAHLSDVILPPYEKKFMVHRHAMAMMDRKDLCKWLGMPIGDKKIHLTGKNSAQVYRNCVHPLLGQSIMNDILKAMTGERAAG